METHTINSIRKAIPLKWEVFEPEMNPDICIDIDYFAYISDKAIGIQIKPITTKSNFGSYSASERMKANFAEFEEEYGGKVFIIFSLDGEIANKEILVEIEKELKRLNA